MSTRYAAPDTPVSTKLQRWASCEEYDVSLPALMVSKRCEVLDDPTLAPLLWFLQYRSQPRRDFLIGRIGGVHRIADELLAIESNIPREVLLEDITTGGASRVVRKVSLEALRKNCLNSLTDALFRLALEPRFDESSLPGLDRDWRKIVEKHREKCRTEARQRLADTSVADVAMDAMEFTHETGEASLILGDPRLGKSESAKVFCDSSAGSARYVEVPPSNDMRSLYIAVADAIGVARGTSYEGGQIKERIEGVLQRSKIMLVFDEAQNLWLRSMRPKSAPGRILWVNSLINMGAPVAMFALPEFLTWMRVTAEKTGWESKQLEQRIALYRRLPPSLTSADFQKLAKHIAPQLSAASIKYLVGAALEQDGAAFIKKAICAAGYRAKKAGRAAPTIEDIETAVRDDILSSSSTLRDALAGAVAGTSPSDRPRRQRPAVPSPITTRGQDRGVAAPPVHPGREGIATASHAVAQA